MLAERSTLVKLDAVSLKLTLNDKLLRKPFDQAVLSPFLKAYANCAPTIFFCVGSKIDVCRKIDVAL